MRNVEPIWLIETVGFSIRVGINPPSLFVHAAPRRRAPGAFFGPEERFIQPEEAEKHQ
jgi:hypothetical protein